MSKFWLTIALLPLALPGVAIAQDAGWSRYVDETAGYSLDLPYGLFAPTPDSGAEAPVFREIGGEGQINLYQGATGGLSLADFAERFSANDPSRVVTYEAQGQSWFVLSGHYQPGEAAIDPQLIFYTKVLLSRDGERFSGFEISYPRAEKARYDEIVERLEDSFRRPG